MAGLLSICCTIHQPLPMMLPAEPIPPEASASELERGLFDLAGAEQAFSEAIEPGYGAALSSLGGLLGQGIPLSVALSSGFHSLCQRWARSLRKQVRHFVRSPLVDLVCSEPTHGLTFAFDIGEFEERMARARGWLSEWARKPVDAGEVSGFCLNHEIYWTMERLGFRAVLAAGEDYAARGHRLGHPSAWGDGPLVLYRLTWLSEELAHGLRFGRVDPERLADTVAGLPGEAALLSFHLDDIAFGAHGPEGGVELLSRLAGACARRGVRMLGVSDVAQLTQSLALRASPPTLTDGQGFALERLWRDGWWERLIFGRMQQAASARMLLDPPLQAPTEWLLQRANLVSPRSIADPASRPASYFRGRWMDRTQDYHTTAAQVVSAYDGFIRAVHHLTPQEAAA